jgi:hypothetical protein
MIKITLIRRPRAQRRADENEGRNTARSSNRVTIVHLRCPDCPTLGQAPWPSRFARYPISDIVTAMRPFDIRSFRKLSFLVLMPAVVLVGAGCSSFDREWKKIGPNSVATSGLVGRWEGQWSSDVNGHHGKLRCIVMKEGDDYEARFHAKYRRILSFGYTVPLKAEPTVTGYQFHGEADLGALAGGIYHYAGRADGTNFFSTYSCKYDHGTFQMERR